MKYKETIGCGILEIEGTSDEIIKVLKYIDSDNKPEIESQSKAITKILKEKGFLK